MKTVRLAILALLPLLASAQGIINTVAGSNPPYIPFPTTPSKANFGRVAGTAVGADGSVYIADPDDNVVAVVGPTGTLAVIAGTGSAGLSGDGGAATQAKLNGPTSVQVDGSGNVYIADTGNNLIRLVTKSNGVITTIAGTGDGSAPGNGSATSVSVGPATSLLLLPNGTLFFVSSGVVAQISGGNVVPTYSINGGTGAGYLAYDPTTGNIFLSSPSQNQIFVGNGSTFTVYAGTGIAGYSGDEGFPLKAQFNTPRGIWLDASGVLYIVDAGNGRIRYIRPGSLVEPLSGSGAQGFNGESGSTDISFSNPTFLSGDFASGGLILSDTGNFRVRRVINGFAITFAGNGLYRFAGDGGAATSALLNAPTAAYPDQAGNVYVADFGNNRIRKVDTKGVITTIAGTGIGGYGGDGGPSTKALINGPSGLVVDSNGNVYFSDTNNHRIRRISTAGIITTYVGTGISGYSGDGGPGLNARLSFPTSLAIDSLDTIYFVDSGNFRVRLMYANGTINVVAGNGLPLSSGDGDVPLAAGMTPTGVGVDKQGNVYIAEAGVSAVRAILKGNINTVIGNGTDRNSGDGGAAINASVSNPGSMWFDTSGNLYLCTTGALRKIDATGVISTYAGQSNSTQTGFSNDGSSAQGALLSCGDAVGDRFNNIYISDSLANRIRKVGSTSPLMVVTPSNISFSAQALSNPTASQTVQLSGNLAGTNWAASVSTSDGTSWVNVSPSSGTIPSAIAISITSSSLAPGNYSAQVYLSLPNGPPLATLNIGLQVISTPGQFVVLPSRLIFLGIAGNSTAPQQLVVSGTAGAPVTAQASSVGGNWLGLNASSGTIPVTFNVTADASQLSPGSYQGAVMIGIPGSSTPPTTVPITLTVVNPIGGPIVLQPTALTFTTSQGINPAAQLLQISSTTSNATFSASSNGFASVTPAAGITPGTVTVSVSAANLAPGTYTTSVTIGNPSGDMTVPVTLTVTAGTGTLSVDPLVLPVLTDAVSGIAPVALNVGASSGALSWTAAASTVNGGTWLYLGSSTTASGTATTSGSPLTIQVNENGLPAGLYTGSVTVTSGTQSKTIVVRALVGGTQPLLTLSQSSLVFTTVEGATTLPTQAIGVSSSGSINKNSSVGSFTADVPIGSSFASISAVSANAPGTLTVTANPKGLKAGIYTALVRVTAPTAASSPQYATVILNVLAANALIPPVVQPQAMLFGSGSQQTLTVSSSRTTSFQASVVTSGGAWLSTSSASITVSPGSSSTLSVNVNTGSLASGVYTGTVSLVPSDGSPTVTVAVTLRIPGSSCVAGSTLLVRQPGNNFTVQQGVPVNLEATMRDLCNSTLQGSSILATFSNGDLPVIFSDLGAGIYQGTWKPSTTGPVVVTVRGSTSGTFYAAASLNGTVNSPLTGLPLVTSGGVVDGAAFATGVAPGEIISVFGSALGQSNTQAGSPLPTTLSGIKLTIGGIDAPLFFAGPNQVNAQVPFGLTPNVSTQVVARAINGSVELDAAPETVAVVAAKPALFIASGTQGAILNLANQVVDASHPATAGDVITVYATGLGATTPVSSTGQPAVAGTLVIPATATIGGATAVVQYAGATPGFSGLYQLNLVVPAGVASSSPVSVIVSQNGLSSNAATIAVK